MILLVQFTGALYGLLAVLFGAFGAHFLKEKLKNKQRGQFETGVRYQMFHAILLVVLGFNFGFDIPIETYIAYLFIFGTLLFSFSIYGLVLSSAFGRKWSFLGPVTPIGGVLLLAGWALLLYRFVAFIM